jgi:magnesium transporter
MQRFTEDILNDPVGQHARADFSALQPEWSVAQSLDHLRRNPPGGRVIYFYVTTPEGVLVGVVPTRRLVLNTPEKTIREIMVKSTVSVPADATVLEACEFFSLHRLLALPVVDGDRKLVGVVDVELYTDELSLSPGSVRDDVFSIIGVHLTNVSQQQPWKSAKGRFPWLLCNVGGGLLAAVLSGLFQDALSWQNAVLALFVPVVLALAESVTIQSVTLALQGLRASRTSASKLVHRVLAEAGTGAILGCALATLVGTVAIAWQGQWRVGAIVFAGIAGGVACAAMIGVAVPTILRMLKRDPQVAAGPVCLASADAAALLIYFTVATALIP